MESSSLFQSLPGRPPPANPVGTSTGTAPQEVAEGAWGQLGVLCLCLPEPGLLGERCAGGFGCCIRRRPTELEKTAYPGDAPGRARKPTRLREASPWGTFETSALLAGFFCDPVTGEPGRVPPGVNHFPTRTLLHQLLNSTTKGSWT